MKIWVNAAYDNGRALFDGREEVIVTGVTEDRIEYQDIIGWDYGWPTLGQRHSASHASFA